MTSGQAPKSAMVCPRIAFWRHPAFWAGRTAERFETDRGRLARVLVGQGREVVDPGRVRVCGRNSENERWQVQEDGVARPVCELPVDLLALRGSNDPQPVEV